MKMKVWLSFVCAFALSAAVSCKQKVEERETVDKQIDAEEESSGNSLLYDYVATPIKKTDALKEQIEGKQNRVQEEFEKLD